MIKVRISNTSRQLCRSLIASEQNKVSSICFSFKLILANIVKAPRFLQSFGTSLFSVAFTFKNLTRNSLLPMRRNILIIALKLKFTIQSLNFNLKLQRIFKIDLQMALKVVKIDNTVRIWLLLCLFVIQSPIF